MRQSGDLAETAQGRLQGFHNGRCLFFGGIPYAASTAGSGRFRPPSPAKPWSGVRAAAYPGPITSQNPTRFDPFIGPDPRRQSEDSLSLNVWTPNLDDAKRPVYVWIHGGANVSGAGSFPLYDGSSFAQNGDMVCVTINYRLGERGFLHLAHIDESYDTSGNSALLDALAALQWVKENIAFFGGDPDQVTLGGQSAGGNSITGLMMMPEATGLFHRAIIQSASFNGFRNISVAEETTNVFMAAAGASSIPELENAPIEVLLAAQRATMPSRPIWDGSIFRPVVDNALFHKDAVPALLDGELPDIPVIIGFTSEEWNPFHFFLKPEDVPGDEKSLIEFFDKVTGDGKDVVKTYQELVGNPGTVKLFSMILSDMRWRAPTLGFAELLSKWQDVYAYEFTWRSPTNNKLLGAGHCVELPFCFHNMSTPSTPYLIGSDAPVSLADSMHQSWINFIRNGSPGHEATGEWSKYSPDNRTTMMFDETSAAQNDAFADRRKYWDGQI